jgi:S1-C subfamily serine protease
VGVAVYDHYAPARPRRISRAMLPLALALAIAIGVGGWALARTREITELRAEVAGLRAQVENVGRTNAQLSARLGETEKGLAEKRAGIAPLAKRVLRSVFTVETAGSLGSGFVAWQESGSSFLVTAAHVVEDADGPHVRVSRKGGSWTGELVGVDRERDLAVVRINGRPAGAAPLWQSGNAPKVRAGDTLVLVGSPYGLEGTVTTGIVSRVTRKEIQTDAAANPGNSGGPAIDERGRLVGVLVSGGGENLNFAVPIRKLCLKLRSDC